MLNAQFGDTKYIPIVVQPMTLMNLPASKHTQTFQTPLESGAPPAVAAYALLLRASPAFRVYLRVSLGPVGVSGTL